MNNRMMMEDVMKLQIIEGTEINISDMDSVSPFLGGCSNCLQSLGAGGNELTKTFLCEAGEDTTGGASSLVEVSVVDALNYILRWRSFGITFQRHNGQTIQFDETETRLCKSCAEALANLYNSIRLFDSFTNKDSNVNQLTNTFLETIVELANATVSKTKESVVSEKYVGNVQPRSQHSTKFVPYKPELEVSPVETKYTAEDINFALEFNENFEDNDIAIKPTHLVGSKRKVGKDKPTYACEPCGSTFNKKTNLKRHLLLTHEIGGDSQKQYKCDKCDRSYHFQYMLKTHEKMHSEDRTEQCPKCPMKFKGKDGLLHHLKDVHRSDGDKPRCKLCKKGFKQERSLQEHMLMIHRFGKGRKFIPCPQCDAQFKRKRSMLAHLRKEQCYSKKVKSSKAESVGPPKFIIRHRETSMNHYPCPFHCGKTFARKSSMMSHINHLCSLKPKQDFELEDEEIILKDNEANSEHM